MMPGIRGIATKSALPEKPRRPRQKLKCGRTRLTAEDEMIHADNRDIVQNWTKKKARDVHILRADERFV
jgi:hypothetical protein